MPAIFNPASWAPVVLAWSFLLLLPFSRSSELPIFIMAILGSVLIWRHGKQAVWQGGARTFSLLFLCIWVPIVLSVSDSLWFEKSLSTAFSYPRIYLAGIYLIWMLREELPRQRLLKLSAWLLLFWVVDALVQAVAGYDLLGYAYPERLNGLFGPKNWKLGLTLAMLSPLLWEYVSRQGTRWQLVAVYAATAVVVLLSSNRQSWVVFALASLVWGSGYARRHGFSLIKILVPVALAALIAGYAGYVLNPKLAVRIDKSRNAETFTYKGLNDASSGRLQIWENAAQAFQDHPINGVGVRAYRHAYRLYAPKDDSFLQSDGTGANYAHQIVFEVASEAGTIGLVGLAAFYILLAAALRRIPPHAVLVWPALIGAATWLFPLNTHTALYSAYWSLLVGWLLAVGLAVRAQDS